MRLSPYNSGQHRNVETRLKARKQQIAAGGGFFQTEKGCSRKDFYWLGDLCIELLVVMFCGALARMKDTVLFLAVYIGLQGQSTSWPMLAHVKDRQKREM